MSSRRVPQHDYLSPQSKPLRQRDRTPPWAPHMTELDATRPTAAELRSPGASAFVLAWLEQDALRRKLEAEA